MSRDRKGNATMADQAVIAVHELAKNFGPVEAVRGIDLEVQPGEIFGFLGPNGAGKSTTINILCTLMRATSGTATVAGIDVDHDPAAVRSRIGLVFQDPSLDQQLTARENLEFHAFVYDVPAGSRKELERMVKRIRAAWPQVKIIVRGDSGFCREELMAWCEAHAVDYVFGMARNVRLEKRVEQALEQARRQFEQTQQAARVFVEFEHETVSGTWSRRRRVVAKAEHIDGKSNPRFVVTSLGAEQWAAQQLYEELYCAGGDMENRIKEQFVLFADRVSTATMRANQLRLYLSVMAYTLVCGLRR